MNVYIDTSGFLAVLNRDDKFHGAAKAVWLRLLDSGAKLNTNSFVLLETAALMQSRLGLDAVRTFFNDIYPLLEIDWVDAGLFSLAMPLLLISNRKELSLVDYSSFLTMRRSKLSKAFAFDPHFAEQGFEVLAC